MAKWLALLYILEVCGSNLRLEDHLTEVIHGFPQSLQADAWVVPKKAMAIPFHILSIS
jgi:hypothetical protein